MSIKIGIIGSRSLRQIRADVYRILDQVFKKYPDAMLVSGGAVGPDSFAYDYCIENGYDIIVCGAGWIRYGRGAGMRRNMRIVDHADIIIAFYDDKSRGTLDTIKKAKGRKKKVFFYDFSTGRLCAA